MLTVSQARPPPNQKKGTYHFYRQHAVHNVNVVQYKFIECNFIVLTGSADVNLFVSLF